MIKQMCMYKSKLIRIIKYKKKNENAVHSCNSFIYDARHSEKYTK